MSELNLGNLKINQLGYVYRDIKKQARILEENFGLPKFAYLENKPTKYKYRGKETIAQTTIGFSRSLNVQIELIQLIKGECIFKEFIDAGKEGLHHFGIFVEDVDAIVKEYLKKGYKVVHEGITAGVQKIAYMDTYDDFGLYLEFQATKKRRIRK
ncbi:MAG: VOC family protein [Candidatus Lokiarchaeota archaeon]|nr:VOC family protein [Candidatus Lokiarchaeota archaeon]